MFRIDYVGTCPYITCVPSVYHHRLSSRDRFLILSSDGLYQYFTNEEAVSEVELFIASFPEGDPAQHLVEEVLFRAARKAGKASLYFILLVLHKLCESNLGCLSLMCTKFGTLQEWTSMSCLVFHKGNAGVTMTTSPLLLFLWREEYGVHLCKYKYKQLYLYIKVHQRLNTFC